MQHRIKGQLTEDGPSYSVRTSHPLAARLWNDGFSFRTSVGRWAVVTAVPGSRDAEGAWILFASVNVARFTSKSAANSHARRHRGYGPHFWARVVRWRRWMTYPRRIVPVERIIERERGLAALLGLEW